MKRFLSFLSLFCMMLYADEISTAKELFDVNEKYHEALTIFEKNQDNPEATYYLGKAYYYGLGVEKDPDKAFEYAQRSAYAKFSSGLNLLGVLYENGDGIDKDKSKAFLLYSEAANLGDTKAMNNLGWVYSKDLFVKKDIEKARFWFLKSIEYGNNEGYINLGHLYTNENNYSEALKWILKYEEFEPKKFKVSYYFGIGLIYMSLEQYENAYKYILKSTQLGSFEATHNLYGMIRDRHIPDSKTEEAIFWLEQASDSSKNKSDSLDFSQKLLYRYYLYDSNQYNKALDLATVAHKNGNIWMGCSLASQYGNTLDTSYDLEKSFDIATKIISDNNVSEQTASCYSSLAFLYRTGNYLAKDTVKYIELIEKIFNDIYGKKNDLYSKWIAEAYMEDLHDFENAQKWYQITYDLTKDSKYLTKVDEYKRTLPIFDKTAQKQEQNVFPIINNLSTAEQITSFLETEKYYFLATDQKSVNMYDKKTLSLIKELQGWIGTGIAGMTIQMAFDESREYLYCAGINSGSDGTKNELIKVFDINSGNIINTIKNPNSMKTLYLNISQDGRYLVTINQPQRLQIINTISNSIQTYNYTNLINFTHANIEKINNDYIVNALGTDNNLYKFSVNLKRQVSREFFLNQAKFKEFNFQHAKRISPQTIANQILKIKLQNQILYVGTQNSLKNYSFNMNALTLSTESAPNHFNTDSSSSISINQINGNRTLEIFQGKNRLSSIELLTVQALNYSIINNKYIIVTTTDIDAMYVFNLQGRAIASLKGFLSLQKNIHYENGYLLTYGADNVIHIWNLDDLDKVNQLKESYDSTVVESAYKQLGGDIRVMADINSYDEDFDKQAESMMKSMNLTFKPTKEQMVSFAKMFLTKKEKILPLASLYINQNDWIVFDHNGYFASSGNGKNLIRYHQNQGFEKEAKIINNEQIFEKFYRPDLIKKKLAKQDLLNDINVQTVIQTIKPPVVKILSIKHKDSKNIDLVYKVCDAGSGISNTTLILNGISANPRYTRGFSLEKIRNPDEHCDSYKNTLTLKNGNNSIKIKSFDANQTISSTSEEIIEKAQYQSDDQANLYYISIAITNYKNDTLNLKYPVDDVLAVKKKLEEKSHTLFKKIHAYSLHDREVSAINLDKLFSELSLKINTNDVLVVYFAGHGTTNEKDGLYYFYSHDISDTTDKGLQKQAISVNEIKKQLSKIHAQKSLILFDTCDSGGVINTLGSKMLGDRLSQDNSRNFIVASKESALEGYMNHGVFTYVVLDAFDNAYMGSRTKLTSTSLADHIEYNVPEITKKEWHYEQTPLKYLNGSAFDIGVK